jgi:hypothetical protein
MDPNDHHFVVKNPSQRQLKDSLESMEQEQWNMNPRKKKKKKRGYNIRRKSQPFLFPPALT